MKIKNRLSNYKIYDVYSFFKYQKWLKIENTGNCILDENIKFSIIMPVYNTSSDILIEAIDSVLNQTYQNFELILIDDFSSYANVAQTLKKYSCHKKIKIIYRLSNGNISKATNDGISIASGDYIVFMDCDDTIEKNALNEFAKMLLANPKLDFVYSDQDLLTEDSKYVHSPSFKPNWSPDLFSSMMYTNHLAAYRKSIIKETGNLNSLYDGAQDYDFTLRFMEHTDNSKVGHINKVLYHWRQRKESIAYSIDAKKYGVIAARKAKLDFIARNKLKADLLENKVIMQDTFAYKSDGSDLVSVVICNNNLLKVEQCLKSFINNTIYKNVNFYIIVNSKCNTDPNRLFRINVPITIVELKESETISSICNKIVRSSKSSFFLFITQELMFNNPNWLNQLVGDLQTSHAGTAAPKVMYKDTHYILYGGITIYKKKINYETRGCSDSVPSYLGLNLVMWNCVSSLSPCLLISKKTILKLNCFNAHTYDIETMLFDFCFKVTNSNLFNVQDNTISVFSNTKFFNSIKLKTKIDDPFLNENLVSYDYPLIFRERKYNSFVSRLKCSVYKKIRFFVQDKPKIKKMCKNIVKIFVKIKYAFK